MKARLLSNKQKKQMIEPETHEPTISRQCQLLDLNRSSFYYQPRPIKIEDLELMRLIDEQYLKTPSYGSRSMTRHFRRQGRKVNRKRIQRLMRVMPLNFFYQWIRAYHTPQAVHTSGSTTVEFLRSFLLIGSIA